MRTKGGLQIRLGSCWAMALGVSLLWPSWQQLQGSLLFELEVFGILNKALADWNEILSLAEVREILVI